MPLKTTCIAALCAEQCERRSLEVVTPYSRILISTRGDSCCRYAWYKLFNLAKTYNKNLTPADVQQLSCNVLLSALSILPYEAPETARTEAELELEKDRSMRMATILGFNLVSLARSHPYCSPG